MGLMTVRIACRRRLRDMFVCHLGVGGGVCDRMRAHRLEVAGVGWGGGGGGGKKGLSPSGSCVQHGTVCVYSRGWCCPPQHLACQARPRGGDLIALGALGVSGFLSSQISPTSPPPRPCPSSSGRKWAGLGISVCCPHHQSRQSCSLAQGRWLWSQQQRESERAGRSPMSQPGEVPPRPHSAGVVPRYP